MAEITILRLDQRSPSQPMKKRVAIAASEPVAITTPPASSPRPFQTINGTMCTMTPLPADILNVTPMESSQYAHVRVASRTPYSTGTCRRLRDPGPPSPSGVWPSSSGEFRTRAARGTPRSRIAMPDTKAAVRHPWLMTMYATAGVKTAPPAAMPTEMTPKAVPRLRMNHRVTITAEPLWNSMLTPRERTPMKIIRKTV